MGHGTAENPTARAEGRPAPPAGAAEAEFERPSPPRPGEWLHRFSEAGQTFDQYVARGPNRRSAERSAICIQPLGEAPRRYAPTIELMREYAEAFFGLPARLLEPAPIAEEAFIPQRDQYNSSMIIDRLAGRVPGDALVYVAITEKDLFARGLRFVFGEGNLENRCGVCSVTRFETPDEPLFLRRSLRLFSHEAGHILSIEHCVFYRCVMQGANSLREEDAHPMRLCPTDLRKLEWNTGVERGERSRRLLDFYGRTGLAAEAAWMRRWGSEEGR